MIRRGIAIIAFFLAGINQYSEAADFRFKISTFKPHQGEVVKMELIESKPKKSKSKIQKPKLDFRVVAFGNEYRPFTIGAKRVVLIGIHYQLEPGTHPFRIVLLQQGIVAGQMKNVFWVRQKFPPLQMAMPERDEELEKRIQAEGREIQVIWSSGSTDSLSWKSDFRWPIRKAGAGLVTSRFGEKRCRDRWNCRYHRGVDIRSAFDQFRSKPESVYPIHDGIVAKTKDYFLEGKTVIIDHGSGLKSSYFHLSKFLCKEGDRVSPKKPIGIAGKTGSTDAIHLHLVTTIYGAIVDPHQFLKSVSAR